MLEGQMTIVGSSPLLMHNPAAMLTPRSGKKEIPTPEVEAARSAYRTRDGTNLCLRAEHVHAALIAAASGYRIQGKRSVIPYLSGCIEITPEEIPLGTNVYEIDLRTVVVQRQRILRSRAKVSPWSATFTVHYDETVFSDEFMRVTFAEIVGVAGRAVGLLDFRPAKRGRFGRFTLQSWELGTVGAHAGAKVRRAKGTKAA